MFISTFSSKSGVVNVYDNETVMVNKSPKPIKTMFNLTTEVDGVQFNSSRYVLTNYNRLS